MTFTLEFLSTRSGKALLFIQNNKRYLFGYYEGFQRHAIERNIKLSKIDQIFFFSHFEMIPFIGFILTVADMGRFCLLLNGPEEIEKIYTVSRSFAERSRLKIIFFSQNESVIEFHTRKGSNYILKVTNIPGKLNVEKLHSNFPIQLRKSLKERKKVIFNNKEYDGNEFMDDDIVIGNICLLYTTQDLNEFIKIIKNENIKVCICMTQESRIITEYLNDIEIIYFEDNQEIEFKSAYEFQKKLNKLDCNYLMPKKNIKKVYSVHAHKNINLNEKEQSIILNQDGCGQTNKEIKMMTDSHSLTFSKERKIITTQDDPSTEKIVFLGTGSAIPSKYRNVSAILYEEPDQVFLLDCGEDTLSQIDRIYGDTEILQKLKLIFISHSHADHHLGLVSVLKSLEHKVILICSKKIKAFLDLFNLKANYFLTDNLPRNEITEIKNLQVNNLKFSVKLCPVDHTPDSFGILITSKKQISYSGDCRPSELFSKMSKNIDLMIHECTFSDNLITNAIEHKHSTVSEALSIFKESEAKYLILTHFSQRFAKEVPFLEDVFCAFDFFVFNFKNKISKSVLDHLKRLKEEDS